MSISNGPNLGLMENANTGEAHDAALRGLLRGLDGLVMPNVKGYLTNTPPGSPVNGDVYIIGAAPTGAWAGQGGKVTRYSTVSAVWEFFAPKNGWMLQANSARETYRYTGNAWEIFYQEGTWTPAISGSSVAGSNTYAFQAGTYTKTGRIVFINAFVRLSAKDAAMAGTVRISGLPVTSSARSSATFGGVDYVVLSSGYTQVVGLIQATTYIDLQQLGSGLGANGIATSALANNSGFDVSCAAVI